ncbi:MAG: YraN family protein [Prolixibacteraceae bacterium]|nr:YraN family protein [Prolixibacteraceae bacterium]
MAQHTDLGKKGEEIAINHLVNKGYTIRDRNWYYQKLEIDIVAVDGDELVIVEVKTRSARIYEDLRDSISSRKIRFLVNAAEAYIMEHDLNMDTRFDVIGIKWFGEDKFTIEHFPDAFSPPVN